MFSEYRGVTKNGKLKVECWSEKNVLKTNEVTKYCNKKFWFDCDNCPHEFDSALSHISNDKWCPYCVKKLCGSGNCNYCLNKSFASYDGKTKNGKLKVDCWSKNNLSKPYEFSRGSGKICWFNCDNCLHIFDISLNSINSGCWCQYCCIPSKKSCLEENCEYCFKKSFASFDGITKNGNKIIDCWDKIKNGDIKPRHILKGSKGQYWFICDNYNCKHSYKPQIVNIINNQSDSPCVYCTENSMNRQLCKEENCLQCYNNSFASFKVKTKNGILKVDCWNEEKNILKKCEKCINKTKCKKCLKNLTINVSPRDIFLSSNKYYWFTCDICLHNFDSKLGNITILNRWCPYCCIPCKKLCPDENCSHCYQKSFASFDYKTKNGKLKVDCWSDENALKPREVIKYCNKKFWFNCDNCQKPFYSALSQIVGQITWCPNCIIYKGEEVIETTILSLNYKSNKQFKFNDCRNKLPLPFDNCITELNMYILIEHDGIQHFSLKKYKGKGYSIKDWLQRVKRDLIKNAYIVPHNMILVRISYNCIDQTEELIKQSIQMAEKGESGIIYSDPELYKKTYMKYFKFLSLI